MRNPINGVVNRMNSSNLEAFAIVGLFGRNYVELEFDKEVNIYIGENGLGKTTILNCLYYVLKKQMAQLMEIHFDEIRIKFKGDPRVYTVSKADIARYNRNRRNRRVHYIEDFQDFLNDNDIDLRNYSREQYDFLVERYAQELKVPLGAAERIIRNYMEIDWDDHRVSKKTGNPQNVESLIQAVNANVKERIIYLPTYRRIENDFSSLRMPEGNSNNPEMLIRFGMADVQNSIDEILGKIKNVAMHGYNEMTSLLLKQYTEGDAIYQNDIQIDSSIVKIVLDRLGDKIEVKDKELIYEIVNSKRIYEKQYAHLLNLLCKLIANYDLQRTYDDRIKQFENTCNKYLNDKHLYYDPSNLTLDVYVDEDDTNVKLTQLSSGEKQIISLFSKLYLESEDKSIVIIDEPELSLSLMWQQMLLPDIMRSQNCNCLLTVTHSPFIFENEYDMDAKEMRAYIHRT